MKYPHSKTVIYLSVLAAILAVVAFAQSEAGSGQWTFGPRPATPTPFVAGEPFSAELTSTAAINGQKSALQPHSYKIYRDSAGRTMSSPAFQPGGYNTSVWEVDDPVAGSWYVFDARTRTAYKSIRPIPPTPPAASSTSAASSARQQDLGVRMILGVQASGTITAAADGSWSVERWFCSDLHLVMMTRSYMKSGTGVNEITSLQLGEPPSESFQVPSGYAVVSKSGPFTLPD